MAMLKYQMIIANREISVPIMFGPPGLVYMYIWNALFCWSWLLDFLFVPK